MYLLNDIIKELEKVAPPRLAESWDNIGLIIGSRQQKVSRILCALDINEEVVEEAKHHKADCIITHHPLIFKPLSKIDYDTPKGKIIKQLITHNISVYTMHTNYDVVKGGINDILCDKLGIKEPEVLHISKEEQFYKAAVYVPEKSYENVRNAIINEDICDIGNYKGCTFTAEGEGTFIPMTGSNPYIGTHGKLEKAAERKIEFIASSANINKILGAVKKVHPYEEPAIDVLALNNMQSYDGIGRYGQLACEVTMEQFIVTLKEVFNIPYLRMTDSEVAWVKHVAVCSGSGAGYIKRASEIADVYVTSDIKFHEAQEAKDLGLCVIDIGHYASENLSVEYIVSKLSGLFKDLWVSSSKVNGEAIHIK